MRRTIDILLAGMLLLTVGACVDTKKLTGAEILPREQSGKVLQDQSAGRDVNNMTVNIVGDEVLFSGACILGLMAFGWWYAARGRKVQGDAVKDIVRSVDMFKSRIRRELSECPAPHDQSAVVVQNARDRAIDDVLSAFKSSADYQQGSRTKSIVRKLRGKPKKMKDEKETR